MNTIFRPHAEWKSSIRPATVPPYPWPPKPFQFSLAAMLEYVTVCSVLAALSPLVGMLASALLMLMAMAIWARAGRLAMGLLMAILLSTNASLTSLAPRDDYFPYVQPLVTSGAALAIAVWYGLKGKVRREK